MIQKGFDLMTVIMCFFIIYQDFKSRSVSVYVLAVFILLSLLQLIPNYNNHSIQYALVNFALLSGIFILQTGLVSLKKKRFINPVNKTIGLFDILLLICFCLWFSPKNFLFFFIGALLLALFHVVFQKVFTTKKFIVIPLAAYICLFLLICISIKNIFRLNFYDDSFLKALTRKFI